MNEKIEQYLEVSKFLDDGKSEYLLKKMKTSLEEKQFLLPFIGQFSSGKSRLINNIFGRTILPTKGNETTALTTYISFSEREEVLVESADHEFESITFEQLLNLSQTNIAKGESVNSLLQLKNDAESFEIKAVHVKINHPLLQNGLVLVDTPGINTIIRSHEELTYSILPEAQYLVYVLGKSLTEQDVTMVRKIRKLGIDLIFVRTKLDDLKSNEETVDQTVDKDKAILNRIFQNQYTYFGMSNETELFDQKEWKDRFDCFVSFLSEDMNGNLNEILERSIEMRLENYASHFKNQLEHKLHLMDKLSEESTESLTEQIDLIHSKMKTLGREARTSEKEIANHIEPIKQEIISYIRRLKTEYVEAYREELVKHKHVAELQSLGVQKGLEFIDSYLSEANQIIEDKLQVIIQSSYNVNYARVAEITSKINEHFQGSINFKATGIDLSDIQDEKNYAMEQLEEEMQEILRFMEKSDEELKKHNLKREEVNEVLQYIGNETAVAKEEYSNLGEYETQYRTYEGNSSVSETLAKMGNLADWALVFIPGKAITTAGTKLAKVASKTAKALKMGEKAIKATTKIVDGATKLEKSLKKYRKMKEFVEDKTEAQPAGVLDLISLEFWFRKAGTLFDEPPRIEVDRNYQYVYENTKQELTTKYQAIMHKELKQLEELELIQSKEEKMKKEVELKQRYLHQIEQELKREDLTIRKKAKEKAALQYIDSLASMFDKEVQALNDHLKKELETGIVQLTEDITLSVTTDVQNQLDSLKKNVQELIVNREKSTEERDALKREMEKYLSYLM